MNFIDYPASDIVNIWDNIQKGEKVDIMNLESWKLLPIAGRTLYWTLGKGEEKEKRRRGESGGDPFSLE